MKPTQYTQIVEVNSTQSTVVIKYRPMDSEPSSLPLSIMITPHKSSVNFHFSNLGGKCVRPEQITGNDVEIRIIDENDNLPDPDYTELDKLPQIKRKS